MTYTQRGRDHSVLIEPINASEYREVWTWCETVLESTTWFSYSFPGGARFIFKSDREATAFKLRWAGVEFGDG